MEGHGRAWQGMEGRWKGMGVEALREVTCLHGAGFGECARDEIGDDVAGGDDGEGDLRKLAWWKAVEGQWKAVEGHGRPWKAVEGRGRPWKVSGRFERAGELADAGDGVEVGLAEGAHGEDGNEAREQAGEEDLRDGQREHRREHSAAEAERRREARHPPGTRGSERGQ